MFSLRNQPTNYTYSAKLSLFSQMKSWIAVNPSFGCVWDCAYCIQHKDRFFDTVDYKKVHPLKRGDKDFTPEEIVAEIMINPRVTSRSKLTFYNFSDPFLPQNTSNLVRILKGLDEREFKQIVGLITRTNAPEKVLDDIAGLQNIKPIIFVSYAGYKDRRIEAAPNSKRLDLMKKVHERKIPVIQYLRPVVREWLTERQFERMNEEVQEIIDGVVMSGLRLTPEIVKKIKSKGLPLPKAPNHTNKFFPADLQEQILKAYEGAVPVYRYTSCAVSATFGIPDYNAHLDFLRVVGEESCGNSCSLPCIENQRQICLNQVEKKFPLEEQVKRLQEKIGQQDRKFAITLDGRVVFADPLSKEDLSFFRHNLSRHIDYDKNHHHFDQVYYQGDKKK